MVMKGNVSGEKEYVDKLSISVRVCMAVRNAINSYGSKWQTILSRTFSAEILYNSLCKDNKGNKYISDKALAHMRRVTLGMDNDKDIEY